MHKIILSNCPFPDILLCVFFFFGKSTLHSSPICVTWPFKCYHEQYRKYFDCVGVWSAKAPLNFATMTAK